MIKHLESREERLAELKKLKVYKEGYLEELSANHLVKEEAEERITNLEWSLIDIEARIDELDGRC